MVACGQADVDRAVAAARRAFEAGAWSALAPRERKAALLRLAALIEAHKEELALLETLDMGKPIRDALQFDLPETIQTYAWYGEAVDKRYDEIAPTAQCAGHHHPRTRGRGGGRGALELPLLMAAWKVAPALAAGNSVILKPAEQSSLSAIRLAALVEQAGIPAGAFQVLPGAGPVAGRALGLHPDVDCVAFTGSTATGKRFMTYSGESNLKRVWLECGGKSPHIVFEDCPDLDRAALIAALAIFSNQGEVCIAGSRCAAGRHLRRLHGQGRAPRGRHGAGQSAGPGHRAGRDGGRTADALGHGAHRRRPGRGRAAARRRPPGARGQRRLVHRAHHLRLRRPQGALMREEIFGPVLAAQRFGTEDEAIALANDSSYGLGAGLWTANLGRAHRLSRRLRAGLVWVNCYADGDVTVPFGGVKQSGFGRDKSLHALDKYSDLKTTWIDLTV